MVSRGHRPSQSDKLYHILHKIDMVGSLLASNENMNASNADSNLSFNCAVLGDVGVGKTSFINRVTSGQFSGELTNSKLNVKTTGGNLTFNMMVGSTDAIDCAIVIFDISRIDTCEGLENTISLILEKNGRIPIILVGNKQDLQDPTDKNMGASLMMRGRYLSHRGFDTVIRMPNVIFHRVSARCNRGLEYPFLSLSKMLVSADVKLLQNDALLPLEVLIS